MPPIPRGSLPEYVGNRLNQVHVGKWALNGSSGSGSKCVINLQLENERMNPTGNFVAS